MAKILLVEDDNNLREIYEARLQAEGYTIVAANDGEQALVVAKNERPDLVISDVMMPKISGFEMLDILRNTDGLKDVKVIMLTALGQSEDKTRADQLGANKYLVKSQVTLEDIVKTAHQLLDDEETAPTSVPSPDAVDSGLPGVAGAAAALANPQASVPVPAPATATADDTAVATPVATAPVEPAEPAEPVAVPTPAAAPAPTTLPDPVAVDPRTDADPANDPLTTAEETAAMQAQISSFEAEPAPVPAAATPEAAAVPAPIAAPAAAVVEPSEPVVAPVSEPAPAVAPETAPAVTVEPSGPAVVVTPPEVPAIQTVTPTVQPTNNTDANDTTMAAAVDSLSPAPDLSQKPSDVTAVEVPPETTAPVVAATPAATDATEIPPQDDGLNMHKKITIKPLTEPTDKKDINQLLAEEMAKTNPAAGTTVPAPSTPQSMTPPTSDPNVDDPNSVAL